MIWGLQDVQFALAVRENMFQGLRERVKQYGLFITVMGDCSRGCVSVKSR
jgi:hypothetical protein